MTTARAEQGTVFFNWITGADGLDHAVLEPDLTLAGATDERVAYPALCRYSVIPDVHLSRPHRCCADCVNELPVNAHPLRERHPTKVAAVVGFLGQTAHRPW
jgi:hypothetical protein